MKETMKEEAAKRMRMLGLKEDDIKEFVERGTTRIDWSGLIYTKCEDKIAVRKEKIEQEYGCLVYKILFNYPFVNYLYVSKYEDEWPLDRVDIEEKVPIAYVYNLSDDLCSEFGSIKIENEHGYLVRTA